MSRSNYLRLVVLLAAASPAFGQPTVGGLLNNYSYIRPGLPNYGIAQGSIFDIFGTELASKTASQGVPLQTSLAGTSISVTVGGTTTNVIPYFVSTGQIAAILPSATPVGTGTITVTTSSGTSAPAPITVVASAFGLLTITASGTGAARAYNYTAGNTLLSQTNAANPGEYLVLWGSGLGPAPGDETQYQTPTNLSGIPVEVDIGGVKAKVTYRGRSAYPGLDQINVIVPAGVSGCNVSLVVTSSGNPGNFSTIPVAASGRTCSDPATSPFSTAQWQSLSTLSSASLGFISLGKITTTTLPQTILGITIPGKTTSEDETSAFFVHYTSTQLKAEGFGQSASLGSCIVTTFSQSSTSGGGSSSSPVDLTTVLDAGPQINLSGPDGNLVLAKQSGFYFPSGIPPAIIPAGGGTFTYDNGSGGADVGAFTTTLNESQSDALVWTNASSLTSVNRSQGATLQWTGGVAGSFAEITGSSFSLDATTSTVLGATFVCTAPVSAGQFTIPASVLASLPASSGLLPGNLSISNYAAPQSFSAPGLNAGMVVFFVENGIELPYI